jgi:hypothetical protein
MEAYNADVIYIEKCDWSFGTYSTLAYTICLTQSLVEKYLKMFRIKNQACFEIVRCLEMIQDWLVKWLVHALDHLKRHFLSKHWEGIFFRANKPRCWSTLESITSFSISNGFKFLVWMEFIKLGCWVHHMNHNFNGLMLCQWKFREEKMCPKSVTTRTQFQVVEEFPKSTPQCTQTWLI